MAKGVIIVLVLLISLTYVNAQEILTFRDLWDNFKEVFSITSHAVDNQTILPLISIFYPLDGSTTYTPNITIVGSYNNADVIYSKANDETEIRQLLEGGHWSKKVALKEGSNLISFHVCKNDVCSDTKNLNLNYDPYYNVQYGYIYLVTIPVSSDVYLDDKHQGKTPELINLTFGLHNISLKNINYTDYSYVINITSNKTLNRRITLTKINQTVNVAVPVAIPKKITLDSDQIKRLKTNPALILFRKIFRIK